MPSSSTDAETNGNKKRKASVSGRHYNHYKELNTSMIKSKFLSNPEDLGVVAVGFSGGQVRSFSLLQPLVQIINQSPLLDPPRAKIPRPR